jgi:hypothetical protein
MSRYLEIVQKVIDDLKTSELGDAVTKKTNLTKEPGVTADALSRSISTEDFWEWVEERSAIIEASGGLSRNQADYRAFKLWFDNFSGGAEFVALNSLQKPQVEAE